MFSAATSFRPPLASFLKTIRNSAGMSMLVIASADKYHFTMLMVLRA
jgi:hypothetical protein